MRAAALLFTIAMFAPLASHAALLNLKTITCDRYENEVLPASGTASTDSPKSADTIDTVMWLFGYSVAKAGQHVMYNDALMSFGFSLDAVCKNNPSSSLLDALGETNPKHDKPMDLTTLTCATFVARHAESASTDPASADTIMMWLYGYSVGLAGTHFFDTSALGSFDAALKSRCQQHPEDSVYDALTAVSKSHKP